MMKETQEQFLKKSIVERKKEHDKITKKFPDRVPVICILDKKSRFYPMMKEFKFVAPKTMTFGEMWTQSLRPRFSLDASEALFTFVKNHTGAYELISPQIMVEKLYQEYKNKDDGFLYLYVQEENTFGF
jgi:hypothetical protein